MTACDPLHDEATACQRRALRMQLDLTHATTSALRENWMGDVHGRCNMQHGAGTREHGNGMESWQHTLHIEHCTLHIDSATA